MCRIICLSILLALPLGACSDNEILSVAATVGANNAVGETADVYRRIARGAQSCWFSPGGLNKKSHMFYARVDPIAEGGKAEISIRRRLKNGKAGARAYVVNLIPSGDNTLYSMRNISLDRKISARMSGDIERWVKMQEGCAPANAQDWQPKPAPARQ